MIKNLSTRLFCLLFLMLSVGAASSVNAQELPIDSKVKIGKLSNGLTYYIRQNAKPEKKVELQLVLKAGSILEDDDQQGLAHFMEHMNFNGLKSFPKNEMVSFLQSIGVQFGADLNAYTGFDETVYMLPLSTENEENLKKGFLILSEWGQGALLEGKDIDEERGVVLEESRGRKGAGDRMMKQYLPHLLAGSRYAERLPIGKDHILENFKHDVIRRYFRDWYRPDLMAVIVVGDLPVEKAEAYVKQYFSGLKNPKSPRERVEHGLKPYTSKNAMVVTDKEATRVSFDYNLSAMKEKTSSTVADYRHDLIENLAIAILNKRFAELSQGDNPPFNSAYGYFGGMVKGFESFSLSVSPTVTNIEKSIKTALLELRRANEFGFTNSELELQKKSVLASYEKGFNERNSTQSTAFVSEYRGNFLAQEPIPGIEFEYNYVKMVLPGITLDEVNQVIKERLHPKDNDNYFALITGPESKDVNLPTAENIKTWISQVDQEKITAKEEKVVITELLTKQPQAGTITQTEQDKDFTSVTYTLSNGLKVTIKETDFKSDEILMYGVKKGGTNAYVGKDKYSGQFLSEVVSSMGYGQFTPTQLKDALAGKVVSARVGMNETHNTLNASSSIKDLETMMQLVHLVLTNPRKDENLFNAYVGKVKQQVKFITSSPEASFIDSFLTYLYKGDVNRPIPFPTESGLSQLNMNRVLEIYQEEFANAAGFEFVIVGNANAEKIKPLLEKYIASLPVKSNVPSFKPEPASRISGKNDMAYYKGTEPKSLIVSTYYGEMPFDEVSRLKLTFLTEILTLRVIEEIREKMGAIYSGSFSSSFEKDPKPKYEIGTNLSCSPENVKIVLAKVDEIINDIRTKGPEQEEINKVRSKMLEGRKEAMKQNNFWLSAISNVKSLGYTKDYFLKRDEYVNQVSKDDIKNIANQAFGKASHTVGVLYPQADDKK